MLDFTLEGSLKKRGLVWGYVYVLTFWSWLVILALGFGLLGACLSRISSPAIVSEVYGVVVVQVEG